MFYINVEFRSRFYMLMEIDATVLYYVNDKVVLTVSKFKVIKANNLKHRLCFKSFKPAPVFLFEHLTLPNYV